jgi:hypothetical protein
VGERVTQPLDPDLTPEWLQGVSPMTALENTVFEYGILAAKITMLNQRLMTLCNLIAQGGEIKNANDENNN